jgi:membrane-associated protein
VSSSLSAALLHLNVSSVLSYAIAFGLPALDALIFVLPAETAVIALGVATAGSSDPRIALLVVLAAAGAFIGDNGAYWLGRRLGPSVGKRIFGSERGARRRAWAEQSLSRFGAAIIVVCRFIPGGRTAVTLTCGMIGYPVRRFVPATALAGVLWASYAFFIGRLGGTALSDNPWAGLLLALGLVSLITLLVEAGRRCWQWRKRSATCPVPAPSPAPSAAPSPARSPAPSRPRDAVN